MTVGELLRRGRIPAESVAKDVEGWLHSFFSFIASGPPPERLEQLVALNEAGIVQFLGPDSVFSTEIDPATGLILSRAVRRTPTSWPRTPSSKHACRLRPSARAVTCPADASRSGRGSRTRATVDSSAKLAVDGTSRILDRNNTVSSSLRGRAVGCRPQLVGGFPRPRTNAGFFRHNDALAAEILALRACERLGSPETP
ncbi:hypothetical protein ACETU7_14930 [Rhodococcus sp. 3Y1]